MVRMRKRVYVSGPISGGPNPLYNEQEVLMNVHQAIIAGQRLSNAGFAPLVPHLSHWWNELYRNDWYTWLEIDESWVSVCDCVLRIPGKSQGADREVQFASALGKPVYFNIDALIEDESTDELAPAVVLALTGYARSGKDTVGQVLVDEYGFERKAFADPLKAMALGIDPYIQITSQESGVEAQFTRLSTAFAASLGWEELKSQSDIRRLLQRLGTEGARQNLWDSIWIDKLVREIQPDNKYVVTDCRFPNEADAIHKLGGLIIRIERPGLTAMAHDSERLMNSINADFSITNDSTISVLHDRVRAVMAEIGISKAGV